MKNTILLLLTFTLFSISCKDTEIIGPDCAEPAYTRYHLELILPKESSEANNIPSGKTYDSQEVYFYYFDENQNKTKISTSINEHESKNGKTYIKISSGGRLFDPFLDKGLKTFFLQKRNNRVDTLQIDITSHKSKSENGCSPYEEYKMHLFKINGKEAESAVNYNYNPYEDEDEHYFFNFPFSYWLRTPPSS